MYRVSDWLRIAHSGPTPSRQRSDSFAHDNATELPDFKESGTGYHQENVNVTLEDVLPSNSRPWYRTRSLLILNFLLLVPILSSSSSGFDASMLNGLQSQTQWASYLGNPSGYRLGNLSCGPTFGNIIGVLPGGYIADKWGRKWGIAIGSFIAIIATIIQTTSISYGMFLASRIIIGIGTCIAIISSPSLLSELAYPTHRATITTAYNIMWYGGATIAAWVTYGTYYMGDTNNWSWRIPSMLQALFPVCQLALIYFVPESPRFLIFHDRIDEARKILVNYHADGDENSPLISFELSEIIQTLELEKQQKNIGFGVLFAKKNRRRAFISVMIPFMQQMSGNGLVSYYLSLVLKSIGISSAPQQLIINGGLCLYNWGIAVILMGFIPKFGRRTLLLTSTLLMLVMFVIWTVLSAVNQQRNFEDKSLGKGVLAMIFLYYLSYNIGLLGLPYLYLTEVLPYYIRTQGMSLGQFTGACAGIYNSYVNPIAMDAISWKYYIVYCAIICFEFLVVFFFFPETKGATLEESTDMFERSMRKSRVHASDIELEVEDVYLKSE
ncbi:general substrate transporter [Kockiozyma suomiensis]|uniref:general substrate transporter n=1 Tax=Kockiozyma suomiensis TaxID=1337062 RepID=UPI0033437D3F